MFKTSIFGSVKTRRPSGDRARASKAYPSSTTSADITNTYSRSMKEAEYLAEKAAVQSRSPDKLQRSLFGYDLEWSQRKRSLDPETSSDMFSPPIPTSPLSEYSYLPEYAPLRRSKELPKEATPEPQRRTPTRQTPREVSPPPKYHKQNMVKPKNMFVSNSIYALEENCRDSATRPKPRRLALAASRESWSSKKNFESYKRQTRNQVPSRIEELDNDPEIDDTQKSMLGDIAAIGDSSSRHAATRALFHHAINEQPKPKL